MLNTLCFDMKEEYKSFLDFIEFIINFNKQSRDQHIDLHIYNEVDIIVCEFAQLSDEFDDKCCFKYIDENHTVMYVGCFPDNSTEYFESKYEFEQALNSWLKQHPGYFKNEYGQFCLKLTNTED